MTTTAVPPLEGYVAPGFEPVRDAFAQNFQDSHELGAGFAAYIGEDLVVDLHGGYADKAATQPWTSDTMVPVFSATKGVSALVVAYAVQEHASAIYDTLVADVWPEFAAHGKDAVTIAEMLSHQAGLSGFVEPIDPDLWFDGRACAAALAAMAPIWPLGEGSGYHPNTWGHLAGEIAFRLTGETLGTMLARVFTNANGDDANQEAIDFRIGTPPSEFARIAELKKPKNLPTYGDINAATKAAFLTRWSAPDRRAEAWTTGENPAANGIGTARAMARLYSIYAHRGRLGGRELLAPETFDALSRRRIIGPDKVLPFDMEFGAGVWRNNNAIFGPNPESLGHCGWGGPAGFGDPDRGVSAGYICNQQDKYLQGDPRSIRLFNALYGCL